MSGWNPQVMSVRRTARYWTYGQLGPETQRIWFVLHGYGQSADRFAQPFEELPTPENVVVAPEALSRFYTHHSERLIGASWMTSRYREEEIRDYVHYLDQVWSAVISSNYTGEVVILGFSQGTATASRWALTRTGEVEALILLGGWPATELTPSQLDMTAKRIILGHGEHDDIFLGGRSHNALQAIVAELPDKIEQLSYPGGHTLNKQVVDLIYARLLQGIDRTW